LRIIVFIGVLKDFANYWSPSLISDVSSFYYCYYYSLRTKQGIHFFPRIFYMLFAIFNFYNFSFPFGFSYSALVTSMCFMMHSMLFFWHRWELPAVVLGRVSPDHPRQHALSAGSMPSAVHSPPGSGRSTPEQHVIPGVNFVPMAGRLPHIGRSTSFSTEASGRLSRISSAGGLFHAGGGDDDGSYMFFMDGEVVTHRDITPSSNNNNADRARTPSPVSSPTVDPAAAVTEPRRNTHRSSGSNNTTTNRQDAAQQQRASSQRFVSELDTLLASGRSTDEFEEQDATTTPLMSRLRYDDYDDNDGNETSALQAILNASGDDDGSACSSIIVNNNNNSQPHGVNDPLLPPSVPRSPLLNIPGIERGVYDVDDADDRHHHR